VAAAAALVGCSPAADTKAAEEAVTKFHQGLDAAQFEAIYADAAEDLKKVSSAQTFVPLLTAIQRKLGVSKSTQQQTWRVNYATSGTFITLSYATVFEGGDATEQFVFRISGAQARLAGYHINSEALVLK
jgi:hypothetical protein